MYQKLSRISLLIWFWMRFIIHTSFFCMIISIIDFEKILKCSLVFDFWFNLWFGLFVFTFIIYKRYNPTRVWNQKNIWINIFHCNATRWLMIFRFWFIHRISLTIKHTCTTLYNHKTPDNLSVKLHFFFSNV